RGPRLGGGMSHFLGGSGDSNIDWFAEGIRNKVGNGLLTSFGSSLGMGEPH
ncbi:hypothetical protein A2U01_0109516, partial [Trifolium medium]|nr:hypothetical protein [Trifolium medium]